MTERKPFGPMYQRAMREHARERGLRGAPMAVLRVLLDHCNGKSGQSRPGRQILMDEAPCAEKTLERALKRLRQEGFIAPIAYPNGGRGCATVYAFALPAWSGQQGTEKGTDKTSVKTTEERADTGTENLRHSDPKPPSFSPKTSVKMTDPTERTDRTGEKASASRGQVSLVPDPDRGGEMVSFGTLITRHGYTKARAILERGEAAIAAE